MKPEELRPKLEPKLDHVNNKKKFNLLYSWIS